MSQFNVFQAFYMSFYSKELYRDVGKNWGGKAFLYLFLMTSLLWIITAAATLPNLARDGNEAIDAMSEQLPIINIKDGIINTPENRPYIIKSNHDKFKLIIDTSGEYTNIDKTDADILIASKDVQVRKSPDEIRIYTIPKDTNQVIDAANIKEFVTKIVRIAAIPVLILIILFALSYHVIKALVYALIGLIFTSDLPYSRIFSIAMIAITPAMVLDTIITLCHLNVPLEGLVCLGISLVYMFMGIKATKE